ncbi:hypothetical protein KIN20_028278, partial [Parelaphostrongylus tenuis]
MSVMKYCGDGFRMTADRPPPSATRQRHEDLGTKKNPVTLLIFSHGLPIAVHQYEDSKHADG